MPINVVVAASFSESMNPATITTSTFTLAGPTGAVGGAVTYNATGSIATFTPAANLAYNTPYTATITTGAANTLGIETASNYSWSFTTITPAPTVTAKAPTPGATGVPINQVLSAQFSEAMTPATINSTTFTLVGPSGPVTPLAGTGVAYNATTFVATFTPAAPLSYNTTYIATISTGAQDQAGTGLATNYTWSFTTIIPPPAVVSTVPVNGATGVPAKPVNQVLTATFNEAVTCPTPATADFLVTGPLVTGPGTAPVLGSVTCTGNVATFTPNNPLAVSTLYTATITTGVTNAVGTPMSSNYVWNFLTVPAPTIAPTVIATVPANLAVNVPVNQAILATFSEAMTAATISPTTFTLVGPSGPVTPLAGTGVTYNATGSIATFTPAANLAYNTVYTATITTGVTGLPVAPGLSGTAMASNYVWTFTTAAASNTTPPTVISTIPLGGAINVPLNQIVSATFSEPMNPATINSTNFTLTSTAGGTVAGIVAYAAVGNTLVFTPSANLVAGTLYTANITTGVKDLSGNALVTAYPWTFTTLTKANTISPELVSTFPVSAASGVSLNAAVSGTFNEAMNPLTISTSTFTLTATSTGTPVAGTVSYEAGDDVATFTPTTDLLANTQYSANISGATDLKGNPLATGGVPNPWLFTTAGGIVPPPVLLGSTISLFGGFGGTAGITNSGDLTVINGDIGTTAASTLVVDFHDNTVITLGIDECSYTESPIDTGGLVNGTIYTAPGTSIPTAACPNEGTTATSAFAAAAAAQALAAYNAITPASMPGGLAVETCPGCGGVLDGAGELGNRTLAPGVYVSTPGTYAITAGPLTLDAAGNTNAVWVFQMGTSLTVGTPTANESVILANGAQANNVYWQVGSSATINGILGGGVMVGTIIAQHGITVSTAGVAQITTVNGRLLSLGASVTMVNTVVNVPLP